MADTLNQKLPAEQVSTTLIDTASRGSSTVLTLCRPEKKNALSFEMRRLLLAELKTAMADPGCRSVVLTGSGGSFSAGADLQETSKGLTDAASRERLALLHEIARTIILGPKPVIAAVDGVAYGAGFSLAAACDFVVATERTEFCAIFGKVGLMPDAGLLWTLPRRVGYGQARRIVMTAARLPAEEAQAIGLVDQIVSDPSGLLEAALSWGKACEAAAPLAIGAMKTTFAEAFAGLDVVLEAEADFQPKLGRSKDCAEGKAAFFQKRAPAFRGE